MAGLMHSGRHERPGQRYQRGVTVMAKATSLKTGGENIGVAK